MRHPASLNFVALLLLLIAMTVSVRASQRTAPPASEPILQPDVSGEGIYRQACATCHHVDEAGEHGGALVYGYAGGVGIRSGDPKDVERLLLAGYYQQALAERSAGRGDQAADLLSAAAARFPTDPEVQMLAADSLLRDRKDPQGALDALAKVTLPPGNRFMAFQHATLQADAYEAVGRKDEAASALESVLKTFPNPRLQQRADALRK
jgi:tetratricopeptide (TPR) repeat protein